MRGQGGEDGRKRGIGYREGGGEQPGAGQIDAEVVRNVGEEPRIYLSFGAAGEGRERENGDLGIEAHRGAPY